MIIILIVGLKGLSISDSVLITRYKGQIRSSNLESLKKEHLSTRDISNVPKCPLLSGYTVPSIGLYQMIILLPADYSSNDSIQVEAVITYPPSILEMMAKS